MNSDPDYTICNLDNQTYATCFSRSEIPPTIYGYTSINNRTIDTGQISYGTDLSLQGLGGGGEVPLSTNQPLSYQINTSVIARAVREPVGYGVADSHAPGLDYSIACAPSNGERCMELTGRVTYTGCGEPLSHHTVDCNNAYIPHQPKSDSHTGLQSKPFRWMQIRRNPGKSGNDPGVCCGEKYPSDRADSSVCLSLRISLAGGIAFKK